MDKILVTTTGAFAIIFTYWFFFRKKEEKAAIAKSRNQNDTNEIEIIVEGGYSPQTIMLQKDETTRLNFTRRDANSCLEEVVLPDFKIKEYLPLNKTVGIEITPQKAGKYQFSCGMGMFHGKIIVSN